MSEKPYITDIIQDYRELTKMRENLPGLSGLEIEWDYESKNPLGRRGSARLNDTELAVILNEDEIPVKLYSREVSSTGILKDISEQGFAVLSYKKLPVGIETRVAFFLGKTRISSQAEVRNISYIDGKYRIGLEFTCLRKNDISYILGLMPSKLFNKSTK